MTDTDPLTWLREVEEAMTPGKWEAQDAGTENNANEWDAENLPSYWTWEIAAGDDAVLGGQEIDDPRANVAALVAMRNLAPAMLAVIEAAQRTRDHEQFLKGDPDAFWMEYAEFSDALDALTAAVREEQQRHGG